jgi:hypothetical protein
VAAIGCFAVHFSFQTLFVQSENETSAGRNLVPPVVGISEHGDTNLKAGVFTFGNHQPMPKTFKR